MENEYFDGDFVLILKSPFFKYFLKRNRDIVFYKEPFGRMIKRIDKINQNQSVDAKGLNDNSISKDLLKNIPYSSIEGLVIFHYK